MAFSVGTGKRGPQADINVTPLIDVVLVLLIIFMVMTPVMLKELVAKVPQQQTENVPLPPGESAIVVELDAHDQLALNGFVAANVGNWCVQRLVLRWLYRRRRRPGDQPNSCRDPAASVGSRR